MDPRIQLPAAGGLVTTPWWSEWLDLVHQGFSTIAVICGAVIGVVSVYRMWKASREKK